MFNQDNYDGSVKGKQAFVRMSLEIVNAVLRCVIIYQLIISIGLTNHKSL